MVGLSTGDVNFILHGWSHSGTVALPVGEIDLIKKLLNRLYIARIMRHLNADEKPM